MKLKKLIESKRDDILRIAKIHGAGNVRIFGSVTRGEDTEESDVDILVTMDSGRTLFDLIGFNQDLEDFLGCKVDVISDRGLSPYFQDRILSEAVRL